MRRETRFLRFLLVLLLIVLVVICGFLYLLSLESAQDWPELAHLRLTIYLAVIVGLVPVVVAIKVVFDLLAVIDRREVFSAETVRHLRQMRLLIGAFAGYFVLGFVGFWIATGLMHISLVLAWFALEVAALFLLTVITLLERIFVVALELREDNELTV